MIFNDWFFIVCSWNKDIGLSVYINGKLKGNTSDTIEVQSHGERSTNMVIGRSNKLDSPSTANSKRQEVPPEDTHTKMGINQMVLFDQYIPKEEAEKVTAYYWGHSKFYFPLLCISSLI